MPGPIPLDIWKLTNLVPDDPDHDGAATVGETWRYAELPMLMRNLNVEQIISFWKQEDGSFSQHVEWDAERVRPNPSPY